MTRITGSLVFASLLALGGSALAQTPPDPAAPPPPAEPTPAPLAPAPEPTPMAPEPMLEAPEPSPEVPPQEAEAEEAADPLPTVNGFVEAGYHLDLSIANPASVPVPLRSYDSWNGNTFLLHNAHLAIAHSFTEEVSAVIEIDAGSDPAITGGYSLAKPAVDADGATIATVAGAVYAFDVQEAYAKYSKSGFSLTAGKFATYEGIEVIEGPLNPTFTRGFLYGLAEAFTHVGLKAHYTTESGFDIGVGLVNGWDLWVDNNDWKTIIAKVGYAGDKLFVTVSGSFGSEQTSDENPRLSLDLTGGILLGALTINFQGNFDSENQAGLDIDADGTPDDATWYGFGVQPVYAGDVFTFGARIEYFGDPEGARTFLVEDGGYLNITLTPGVKLAQAFWLRFEGRADFVVGGKPTKDVLNDKASQITLGLGASYLW
jgi:Putative beta-barrel porin-2, OmpL-like. bbp2